MYISESVKEACNEVPMQKVVEDLGIQYRISGGYIDILCPHHNDKSYGNCKISKKKNTYKCYNCGENGNNISLVMQVHGEGFVDAVKFICINNNIEFECSEIEEKGLNYRDKNFLGIDNSYVEETIGVDDFGVEIKKRTPFPIEELKEESPDFYNNLIINKAWEKLKYQKKIYNLCIGVLKARTPLESRKTDEEYIRLITREKDEYVDCINYVADILKRGLTNKNIIKEQLNKIKVEFGSIKGVKIFSKERYTPIYTKEFLEKELKELKEFNKDMEKLNDIKQKTIDNILNSLKKDKKQ